MRVDILPNPNSGIFDIRLNSHSEEDITITLVNYLGMEILTEEGIDITKGSVYHIQYPELPAGLYILNVEQGNRNISRKMLIGN